MPELPEVELVGRYLRPYLVGRRIAKIETTRPSYFFLTAPQVLHRRLPGETIGAFERRGKYLLMAFESQRRLLLHLGMTGQLFLEGAQSPRLALGNRHATMAIPLANTASDVPEPRSGFARDLHTHLVIHFDDQGPTLFFRDARKFGKVRWLDREESDPRLDKLGHDALALTGRVLFLASRKRRLKVKSLLLDQTVTAGIGNIYADESLFLAGIHPERAASSLSDAECSALARIVRRVLRHSISAGGSSIDDYVHPDGSDGGFQRAFRVYGREGEPCSRCQTAISRVVIGQRSSHFCPRCQR